MITTEIEHVEYQTQQLRFYLSSCFKFSGKETFEWITKFPICLALKFYEFRMIVYADDRLTDILVVP